MRRITTDELRYVEVNGHYLYYHTGNEVLKKKMTMKDAEKNWSNIRSADAITAIL